VDNFKITDIEGIDLSPGQGDKSADIIPVFPTPNANAALVRKYNVNDFTFVRVLGKGSFGKVSLKHNT